MTGIHGTHEEGNAYRIWWENLKEHHLRYFDIRRTVTLKWILKLQHTIVWIGFIWFRIMASGVIL
jgi:hypothetical protein